MNTKPFFCIGGLGGSGTRLVANLLHEHNIPIGCSLNGALDNLLFSLMFRRPSWCKDFPSNSVILEAIDIYLRIMCSNSGDFDLPSDKNYIHSLIKSNDTSIFSESEWHAHVDNHLRKNESKNQCFSNWGWKEPNTHVFVPQLNLYNSKMKYVHVVRDGLYMMNSNNKYQLNMWAGKFNVKRSDDTNDALDALRYWIAANQQAINYGVRELDKRFYLLNYDLFCKQPEKEAENLLCFLEVPVNGDIIQNISNKVKYKTVAKQTRDTILNNLPQQIANDYSKYMNLSEKTLAKQAINNNASISVPN